MGLDLNETARILTRQNAGESLCMRAIRLFEFQTCLFYPESLSADEETDIQKGARLLAAMKLLELMEKRIRSTKNTTDISLRDIAEDPDSAEIFDKVIMRSGGWRAIRYTWSSDDLTNN
jgi:hypothetical protein